MNDAYDKDLQSIQEARRCAEQAYRAFLAFADASQERVDRVCAAMAEAAVQASARLGQMAYDETGYGRPDHKRIKNEFSARNVWNSIREIPTVGVIRRDDPKGLVEIAWPVGVVAALSPSTNPTSTVIFKTLIAVKARDAIVHAPHPSAVNACNEAAKIMAEAAVAAGAPAGLVQSLSKVTLDGTQELMRHKRISLILATGGSAMVRAAHSVGKPAYGVGPGNVPCYVDRSANLPQAARYIVSSKSFDHSVICSTEQAVVADQPIAHELRRLMAAEGAYFTDPRESDLLRRTLFHPDGSINVDTVGKSPQVLAQMAGFAVPEAARILATPLEEVGPAEPLSREKLTTALGFYVADGWRAGCDRCIDLIHFGGRGHSLVIHAEDEDVIMAFGLEKPVFRILVNTLGSLGAIGYTTNLMPSLTLGPGGEGRSITGDNITVYHMYDVKRLAFERHAPPAEILVGQPVQDQQPTIHQSTTRDEIDIDRIESMVVKIMDQLESERQS
ncbi:MAG: aldehyde dehydrogenase family protein [Anaerolineales bacterium]